MTKAGEAEPLPGNLGPLTKHLLPKKLLPN
jgi:hypothetical protein